MSVIDITPSPRVLRMLGEIDFKAWQCLCELVDNSIDSFNDVVYPDNQSPSKTISIRLPGNSKSQLKPTDFLEVEDNGRGMTIDELEKSLKAGFSGNDPVEKMGLFGMGFNISTARLGGRTEVVTSTRDNPNFLKVVIDFNELERNRKFDCPVEIIPKKADEQGCHGTKVRITKLRTDHIRPLYNKKSIIAKLGKVYGRFLLNREINLLYGATPCKPFQHCIWSRYRSGESKHGSVPAVIEIDEVIDTKSYCKTCWLWLSAADYQCPSCGSDKNLSLRERKVTGWIGIQRYFSADHYGFDLIRNGRVIKELDKSLFYWTDPDSQEEELEYPIDGHERKGRIVGELEVDFIRVTHTKDAFDENSMDWKDFVRVVRGDSPIRPKIAASLGFPENNSPLALLFSAFRTAKAGVKNLVPSRPNGGAMITDAKIDDLLKRFEEGETDYQSDQHWWDLVNTNPKGGRSDPENVDDIGGPSPFAPPTLPPKQPPSESPPEAPDPWEVKDATDDSQLHTEPDRFLSRSYSLDIFQNIAVRVVAERITNTSNERGFEVRLKGSELSFKYWPEANIFIRSLLTPSDLLINELAYHLHTNAQSEISKYPLSEIEIQLREKYFPELHPTLQEVQRQVNEFHADLCSHIKECVPKIAEFDSSILTDEDARQIREKFAKNDYLKPAEIDRAMKNGEFINYAPYTAIVSIALRYPEMVFDGQFFNIYWDVENQNSPANRALLEEFSHIMADLLWFSGQISGPKGAIWRSRVKRLIGSLGIIAAWKT